MQNSSTQIIEIEKKTLTFWQHNKIFEQSLSPQRPTHTFNRNSSYVFYDGPPFANGLPHYGHLLTGFIKDAFGRYHTMLNKNVTRRFGWDCHGLPAEMGAEKELKISGRKMISAFGIDKFNSYCKESVLRYTSEWEAYVTRQGRWVDFHNDYKTMDINYMESVIWAFKTLYDKNLIYKSERVMPYSWACETPVSDFETKIDNAYRQKASKSVTLTFSIANPSSQLQTALLNASQHVEHPEQRNVQTTASNSSELAKIKLLVWTTTPWTLPSNLALAVGNDITYRCFYIDGAWHIIAQNLAESYSKELRLDQNATDHATQQQNYVDVLGSDIVGSTYAPLFDYFADHKNAFQVIAADFVSTEDGTGVVHIAPGFGEDDYELCKQHDIAIVCPVDDAGKFTTQIPDLTGLQVFDANDKIIATLKQRQELIKSEQYLHNYPHCWRTDEPLIYKAVPSWHLKVTDIKDQMIKNNEQINWIPSHIKHGLFGKWLENARDWSISRNRFWGCPIPVWESDDPRYPHIEVFGSIQELEAAFNQKIHSLHRPYIDTLVMPNPSDPTGQSKLRRVEEVFDCWFESGSMPFAHVHYPFENREWFEQNFPADFIAEYVAQTRGWFYTLMVLSTALFDKAPFLNCICHGVILGDGKTKLSKRLKNYADPNDVFEKIGADAMRWYMLSSNVMRGQEIVIDKEASGMHDANRNIVKPILNSLNFFTTYAEIDKIQPTFSFIGSHILDKYIISKSLLSLNEIKASMNAYDTVGACSIVANLIEILNNWYIRRSRERFWSSEHNQDKIDAYNTLYTVLCLICEGAAPLLPLITEHVYKTLNKSRGDISIHLKKFENYQHTIDHALINDMERVREACTTALAIRNDAKIRVRQPLSRVTFIGVSQHKHESQSVTDNSEVSFNENFNDKNIAAQSDIIKLVLDETNVKTWHNLPSTEIAKYADTHLHLNLPALGQRIPSKIKDLIKMNRQNAWMQLSDGTIKMGDDIILMPNEFTVTLSAKTQYQGSIKSLPSNDGLVMLDLTLDDGLINEGIARDFIRFVQQQRKQQNYNITDKINVTVMCDHEQIIAALNIYADYIKISILAANITYLNADESIKVTSAQDVTTPPAKSKMERILLESYSESPIYFSISKAV